MHATTEPRRKAFPAGLIGPPQRPKVTGTETYTACRSDQFEEVPNDLEPLRAHSVEPDGASALRPRSIMDGATMAGPSSPLNDHGRLPLPRKFCAMSRRGARVERK